MENPVGNRLEYGFYFPNRTGNKAMLDVYEYMILRGGKSSDIARAHLGRNLSEEQYASISDHEISEVRVADHVDMLLLLKNRNVRVVQIELEHGTEITPDARATITQISISPGSAMRDYHPIAILVDGAALTKSETSSNGQADLLNKKVLGFFRDAVTTLKPGYAAITIQSSLQCPSDLAFNVRSTAFRDCFISNDFCGRECRTAVAKMAPDAHIEDLPSGVIALCSGLFRPDVTAKKGSISDDVSNAIAELVASQMSNRVRPT
jgi:hypothetical protein